MSERPHLHRNSQTLSLSLDSSLIQSCMSLSDPDELVLDYTRTMMGFLLLNPAPRTVLMIGLGGGSMLKYLYRHLPDASMTVVEINQEVIDMRHDFHIPHDDERLQILCADGATFVAKAPQRYDVILVDGFTGEGMPDALCSRSFYQHCKDALHPDGLLIANVQADTQQTLAIRRRLNKAFGTVSISVESDEGGNDILFAAPHPQPFDDCLAAFSSRWDNLLPAHQQTLAVCSTRIHGALNQWRRSPQQTRDTGANTTPMKKTGPQ